MERSSAIQLNSAPSDQLPIDQDHSSMVKFGEDDTNYGKILSLIADAFQQSSVIHEEANAREGSSHTAEQMEGSSPTSEEARDRINRPPESTLQTQSPEPEVEESTYPIGWMFSVTTIGLYMSMLSIAFVDSSVLTAIPQITNEFGSLQDISWYGPIYLSMMGAFSFLWIKLPRVFNAKPLYIAASFLVEGGSLISALAPNSTTVIIGRAVTGVGSRGMVIGILNIVAKIRPLPRFKFHSTMLDVTLSLGKVVGPCIGGAPTDKVTWRWYDFSRQAKSSFMPDFYRCFYFNFAVGIPAALAIFFCLRLEPSHAVLRGSGMLTIIRELELLGISLLVAVNIGLLLVLYWAGISYNWSDTPIITLWVLIGALISGLVASQVWMKDVACFPSKIMTRRTVVFASLFGACSGAASCAIEYFFPIWLQAVKGIDPLLSGVNMVPLFFMPAVGATLSSILLADSRSYMYSVIGCTILASIGSGFMGTFSPETSTGYWIGFQIMFSLGIGLGSTPPFTAIKLALSHDHKQGHSIVQFAYCVGGALSISIGSNVLKNQLVHYIRALDDPDLDPSLLFQFGLTQMQNQVSPENKGRIINAYNEALRDTFRVALIASCLTAFGVGMEWLRPPPPETKPSNTVTTSGGGAAGPD